MPNLNQPAAMIRLSLTLALCALLIAGSGCASFRQDTLASELGSLPEMTANRPTVSLEVSGQIDLGRGTQDVPPAKLAAWTTKVTDMIIATNVFSKVRPATEKSNVMMHVHVLNHGNPRAGLAFLSGLTFMVIPAKATDHVRLTSTFRSSSGEELGTVVKEAKMDSWIQILLIFAMPFAWPGSVLDQVWEDLVNATLIDAHQQGLLDLPSS